MAPAVPSSIQVSSSAPLDAMGTAMYITVLMSQLQNWIALAAQILNSFHGYQFSTDASGNLTVTSPAGYTQIIALNAAP